MILYLVKRYSQVPIGYRNAVVPIESCQDKAKPQSLSVIKRKAAEAYRNNNTVIEDCTLLNIRRIYFLSIIAIVLRIFNIFLFIFTKTYDTEVLQLWSQGIIGSHFMLLIFMIGFFLIARKLKNFDEATTTMYILQYVVIAVIMVSGIVIVTFDQLVTTNITPFLLICIVSGAIFLFRPLASLIIFLTTYITYYYSISITITDPQILLSNRVNGITAVGIGFCLSIILWHYNYTNIIQKKHIENQQKQLEQMAYFDPLTDLPNRRLLEKMISREFSSMQRYGYETVVIILDIDDFKIVNDTYGHPAGDLILKQIADLLLNNVRESATVFRFGGEEFIILMPRSTVEEGCIFAERLRKIIMENVFTIESTILNITCSFGVASLRDINSQTLGDYYFLADKALYAAKQKGKNRVEKIRLH